MSDNADQNKQSFTHAQSKALEVLENDDCNVFLTGYAGTGKTYVVDAYLKGKDRKLEYPVLGSTGVSALLVGGRTFHSFFGLGIMRGKREQILASSIANRNVRFRLRKAKTIIIDEVSMLPSYALDLADDIARAILEPNEPWGGLRVITVGDFAQLPPISQGFDRPWAFLAETWNRSALVPIILDEQVRSRNQAYNDILRAIRQGDIHEDVRTFLNERMNVPYDFAGTRLFPLRKQAWEYNIGRVQSLSGGLIEIPTRYAGNPNYIDALKKNAPIPEVLHVKEGAKVMIRINDPMLRFVNGSVGTMTSLKDDVMKVEVDGRTFEFEKCAFSWMDGNGNAVATASNYPVQLSWATTVHKAQGMTLDQMSVDLQALWEPGHAYVAMSRVRSPEGLFIPAWSQKSFKVDPLVKKFYELGCPYDLQDQLTMLQEEEYVDADPSYDDF